MLVQGSECSIVVKTSHREIDIPYSDETLREAVEMLQEEASIEGDGVCRGLRKSGGAKGCIVTPLTLGTAPILLYLAMGAVGSPVFVPETKNLFKYLLTNTPLEDTEHFHLIQDRGGMRNEQLAMSNERKIYEYCRVQGFELRILREETIKLKLEICGVCAPMYYPNTDTFIWEAGERFNGDNVTYRINGQEYTNIYGLTLLSKKRGGTITELWIKRSLQHGSEIPNDIEEIVVTAKLLRDKYEYRYYGTFRITIKKLVLISDETEVNATGAVISPLRYYITGGVQADVFTAGEETIP